LRSELLALNRPGINELERSALAANALTRCYATSVQALLTESGMQPSQVEAIGCHGQTLRHRPDLGYTIQIGNPALLAELTHITVVADFRSRDLAAGGQGAPLTPLFHDAMFRDNARHRLILNIGGIVNLTSLSPKGRLLGFDCGPGNILLDAWATKHIRESYDHDGCWAEGGVVMEKLLSKMLEHPFFRLAPPKSTGRDMFNLNWLQAFLTDGINAQDVQSTLLQLTVESITAAIMQYCPQAEEVYLCGGGAKNTALDKRLRVRLPQLSIARTEALGVDVSDVEALAFAWLAKRALHGESGNLAEATGACHPCILGAIYPV
jgi:anhydro-N-acetylmuramic acid kinase